MTAATEVMFASKMVLYEVLRSSKDVVCGMMAIPALFTSTMPSSISNEVT